jgi:cytosine/adenosine deaminase-related metal-dependent hydrolase
LVACQNDGFFNKYTPNIRKREMVEAVRGKYILIGDDKGSVIEDGVVVFENGTILELGSFCKMERTHYLEKIYGSPNHIVLPGLINSHQHGYGIDLVRVGVNDGPLEPWIINSYYHPDGRSVPLLFENTLLAGLKMLKSGVTTTVHHYYGSEANSANLLGSIDICLKAYRSLGMRVAFAPVIRDRNQFAYVDDDNFISRLPTHAVDSLRKLGKIPVKYPTPKQYFTVIDKLRNQYEDDKTRLLYGPAGPQWCSHQLLKEMNEHSKQEDIGIHMHVLESPIQRKYSDQEYPQGLINYLEGLD